MVQEFIILIKLFNILSSWLASLTIHEKFENYCIMAWVEIFSEGAFLFLCILDFRMLFQKKMSTHCVQLSTCFIDQFLAGENLTAFMYVHNIWPG